MKKNLKNRLNELKSELASGQDMLADLEKKETELKHSMLRIAGAIQVLEEELAKAGAEATAPAEVEAA